MWLLDLFRRKANSEQDIAAQRLRRVLAHDRANISPGMLEVLNSDVISVISKHMDIDSENVVVSFTEDNHETRLMADIPVQSARSRRAPAQE